SDTGGGSAGSDTGGGSAGSDTGGGSAGSDTVRQCRQAGSAGSDTGGGSAGSDTGGGSELSLIENNGASNIHPYPSSKCAQRNPGGVSNFRAKRCTM
uniref:Oxidoreductase n=1 Tax=Macrostomum lignano TaxID=282301 RepID=A0A1I8G2G2_9PLAT